MLEKRLEELEEICADRDVRRLVLFFKDTVPEYNPSAQILAKAFEDRRRASPAATAGARA